ncbi:hypothetical protein GF327_05300 [Candidatus Woesearchaeota archaeon]|nr:hypothetical protein [Candidatus Woesearchaeota archaeon]
MPKRELFSSKERTFLIDEHRIVDFFQEIVKQIDLEAKLRAFSNGLYDETILLTNEQLEQNYQNPEDYYGKTFRISSGKKKGKSSLEAVTLGIISVGSDGSYVNVELNEIQDLAINPETIYGICEEYCVAEKEIKDYSYITCSFPAPFFGEENTGTISARNCMQALRMVFDNYSHPCGLYSALIMNPKTHKNLSQYKSSVQVTLDKVPDTHYSDGRVSKVIDGQIVDEEVDLFPERFELLV